MAQDQEQALEIPTGLVRIDAPDTLQGWKLVEIGSAEHTAAVAAQASADESDAGDESSPRTSRRRGS